MRVYPNQISERAIAAGDDEVIAAVAIPGGSVLKNVWLDVSVVAATTIEVVDACMYGISAYILPVLDPDSTPAVNVMWDNQIPKDDALGSDVIDMDTGTADDDPEFEPGDPSIEELFNVSSRPERIFERVELITFGKQSAGFEAGTPDEYRPRDAFKARIRRNYRVAMPSMLLVGLSAPFTTGTAATSFVPATNQAWMQLKFLADTAKDAWKQAVGLTEAGAETPYEEAATLIDAFLEGFWETTVGAFAGMAYRTFVKMRAEIDVEGEMSVASLSAGAL